MFIAANNPAVTNPNLAKLRAGLAREDLFTVVHDPFMTATTRYADIILPATTYLETEDFFRSYGTYYMQYSEAAVPPQHEAWSNLRVTQTLARRMGLNDPVFGMTPRDILKELFQGASGPVAAYDPAALPEQGPISIAGKGAQVFGTPSGKLEFYSQTLADHGQPPLPGWEPDPAAPATTSDYKLQLLTTPGYFQSHTAFSGVAFLREREGAPCAVLHPDDAKARGLTEGQKIRLFNDRGAIGVVLHVREDVRPGVILVPGQRPDEEAVSGTVNMLCDDGYTDLGEGATYQSTWLEARAW